MVGSSKQEGSCGQHGATPNDVGGRNFWVGLIPLMNHRGSDLTSCRTNAARCCCCSHTCRQVWRVLRWLITSRAVSFFTLRPCVSDRLRAVHTGTDRGRPNPAAVLVATTSSFHPNHDVLRAGILGAGGSTAHYSQDGTAHTVDFCLGGCGECPLQAACSDNNETTALEEQTGDDCNAGTRHASP